jgi:hypothetical protein
MSDQFFGSGLIFEDSLPLAWTPGPPPERLELARMNADNQQLLGAESSLEEARVLEAIKDESPALVHELQRLEYKLNIVLRLTAEISLRGHPLPPAHPVRLGARGLEWRGGEGLAVDSTGLLLLFINPSLPQALRLSCRVTGEHGAGATRVVQLSFLGQSEQVVAQLEKLIFRHHRRLIAGARQASLI